MGMRRTTRASKGTNKLSLETSTIEETKHLGSGKIVEEIETLDSLKKIISSLRDERDSLLQMVSDLKGQVKDLASNQKKNAEYVKSESSPDEVLVFRHKELQSVDAIKMFNAIKSEEEKQDCEYVKISRKEMAEMYKINESKVTTMRDALSTHGFIEVVKDGNKYKFKTLKPLPIA